MRFTLLLSSLMLLCFHASAQKDFYLKRWSDVYKSELKDLPASALKVVDTIYSRAKKDQNITEIVKALLYQSKFAMALEENSELVVIQKFKKEIDISKAPLKNLLESMLAQIYWQHFQANRWKYYGRSTVSETANVTDFRTWDAPALLKEIEKHFQLSLTNATLLKSIRLENFDDILALAEHSKQYRATLYDFLVNYVLDFYAEDEKGLQEPTADKTFDSANYFLPIDTLTFSSTPVESGKYEALKLFQDLLLFYRDTKDTNAYVNLEIERLKFVEEQSTQAGKNEQFKTALVNLKRRYKRHLASTLIDLELASISFNEGLTYHSRDTTNRFGKTIALQICDSAIMRFPKSDGAVKCQLLKSHILSKEIVLKAEEFLPVAKPSRLWVTYTNIDSLQITIYKVPFRFESEFRKRIDDSSRLALLTGRVVQASWQVKLPLTNDYQGHSTELIVPALPHGNYFIIASPRRELFPVEAIYAYTSIAVTDVALLEVNIDNNHRFQLVDRNNGKPVSGGNVHFKSTGSERGDSVINENQTTDKRGFVELNGYSGTSWTLEATVAVGSDTSLFKGYYYYNRDNNQPRTNDVVAKTFLFTDRSIYRPGQTVYFKGILTKTTDYKSSIVARKYVEVFFEDPNSKDIGSLRLKTNSYGSFSGEFKLPSSGITGEYLLYADEDSEEDSTFYDKLTSFDYTETTISVEEYKRPTFEVKMKSLTGTFRLNDTIRISGNANAFNGSKISKAKVAYTVKREVQYPHWYYWENDSDYSEAEEIADGEVETDDNGSFIIPFAATPDEEVSSYAKPVFTFLVSVDVTDINGETRSSESRVKVGYHTMIASIKGAVQVDLQKPIFAPSIVTENLNGQALYAKGKVSIYKLQGPERPVRSRPWAAPDFPLLSKGEFEKVFPNDAYGDDVNSITKWLKGGMIRQLSFDTKKSKVLDIKIDKTWSIGSYVMELETTDSLGQTVEDRFVFEVIDSNGKMIADNSLLIFESDKTIYKSGEVAKVTIGSACTDAFVTVDIEKDDKIVRTFIVQLSEGSKEISIPVTELREPGFTIHCSAPIFNSLVQYHRTIMVDSDKKPLSIETETFKDKIQPGSKEVWSFTIGGQNGEKLEAEVLASMYDASLDQFKPHEWTFVPIQQSRYYSGYRLSVDQSFGVTDFVVKNLQNDALSILQQNFDEFDWFGFNITNRHQSNVRYLERLYVNGTLTSKSSKVTMNNNRNGRQGFISGRVTAERNEALPGVNVVVKGTLRGTATDGDGYYSIEAGKNDVIKFSFVGFVSAEVTASRKNQINVSMESDITELSEVVVVAYGVQVRKNLTGSVASVYIEQDMAEQIFFKQVEGRAPGVQLEMPDGNYEFTIRGNSTLSDSEKPLYVVDGIVVTSYNINQSDLASAQVLKGTPAMALYGSKAANGVIIITTKSGQQKIDDQLAKVNARTNFNETAFFFPHLSTDENGRIKFSFTTPESLTRWKIQLLAHTRDLITTTKTLQALTQKEMMVIPNLPRFVRVDDEVIISAKIANLSNRKLNGKITLLLTNPTNGQSIDQICFNVARNQSFRTDPKGNTQVSWSIKIPHGIDVMQYKIVAKAGDYSDGEQNILPVLQNRTLVTETLPLYVRSNQSKTFSLLKLQNHSSPTLQHHQLTLEITSNPAWYAIQALPYLMEFPHECAEQLFSRVYANSIASHIVNTNPKIKDVFEKWAASGKMVSNLETNPELKSLMIEETPWVRDAESETDRKKRIALLFDMNTMSDQLSLTINKLKNMQLSSGGFPWFSGGKGADRFITQHIASGFGHLMVLKINSSDEMKSMMTKTVKYLDATTLEDFNHRVKTKETSSIQSDMGQQPKPSTYPDDYSPSSIEVHYLYMRSFYGDIDTDHESQKVIEYLQKQTARKWTEYNLYQKAMVALIQYRAGHKAIASDILASLKENAIVSDELGMYWKENVGGWYWHEAEVETQALIVEAFAEIQKYDTKLSKEEKVKTIDELRIWLLKHKQTNSWSTTKATTEAAYALLLNGKDWLPLESAVSASVGKSVVSIASGGPEVGTGYFKTTWKGDAITPDMANVTISKTDEGIVWGGIYWQYFEDLDKITDSENPLKVKKNVYKVSNTDKGEYLNEIKNESLKPGDLIRVRIELTADRTMEYLHMKDMRAAGFEPMDVLSEHKWQEGLGYFQSTRDAATNFFFDRVPKGKYVFEYDLRVNVKGNFSNGITTIQSMYAPEFSSHSEGIRVTVK